MIGAEDRPKVPKYQAEWIGARVEVQTTRGPAEGIVTTAAMIEDAGERVIRLHVVTDSGFLAYADADAVHRIAPPAEAVAS